MTEQTLTMFAVRCSYTDIDHASHGLTESEEFRFNHEGAFVGEFDVKGLLKESSLSGNISSFRNILDFGVFIATPLLPQGEVKHLNGHSASRMPTPAQLPSDPALIDTLNAFVHFLLDRTQGQFVLCDLQGMSAHTLC